MFHRHKWMEVNRRYNPPIERSLTASWLSESMMEQLVFGVTVVELRCVECGDLKHREVIGEI